MAVCDKCRHFDGMTPAGIRCAKGNSIVIVNKRKTRCKQFSEPGGNQMGPIRVNADDVIDGDVELPKMVRVSAIDPQPKRIISDVQSIGSRDQIEPLVRPKRSINRHGFKAISAADIPDVIVCSEGTKSAWIREILQDFISSCDEAWEIDKDFGDVILDPKRARNLSGYIRKRASAMNLACKAVTRGNRVYLIRNNS